MSWSSKMTCSIPLIPLEIVIVSVNGGREWAHAGEDFNDDEDAGKRIKSVVDSKSAGLVIVDVFGGWDWANNGADFGEKEDVDSGVSQFIIAY